MAEVSAPASSGNLGPGFDVLGLALELRCRVVARASDDWSAIHHGPESLPPGADDIVVAAARAVVPDVPLRLDVYNEIPLGRGLGSSSAAAAAGAAVALVAAGRQVDPATVCELVAGFEGHADNAAATVFGGLRAVLPDGRSIPLELHDRWKIVIAVPGYRLPTSEARQALRAEIPRPAVVRSLGRLTALVEGLRTGSAEILAQAAGDEMHETCRHELHPAAAKLIAAATGAGAAHACWSGAGPSVLAITEAESVDGVSEAMAAEAPEGTRVITPDVARTGLITG